MPSQLLHTHLVRSSILSRATGSSRVANPCAQQKVLSKLHAKSTMDSNLFASRGGGRLGARTKEQLLIASFLSAQNYRHKGKEAKTKSRRKRWMKKK